MKVGLIADLHANLPALSAVLHALTAAQVELILCAGDLVCYGAEPSAVIQTLRILNIPSVGGNYDEAIGWELPTASRTPSSPRTEPLKAAALAWTQEQITPHERLFLRNLPRRMDFVLAGKRVTLVHAGLDFTDEWVTPETPETLTALVNSVDADLLLLGHTHQAFVTEWPQQAAQSERSHTWVVNPGPVGRSLDGDTRAAYALWESDTHAVTLHRVAYDLAAEVRAIAASGMPLEIAALMAHGLRRAEQLADNALAELTGSTTGLTHAPEAMP
jgi:putative phosphoesterase